MCVFDSIIHRAIHKKGNIMISTNKELAGLRATLVDAFNRVNSNPEECNFTPASLVSAKVHLSTAIVAVKTEIRERENSQYSPPPQTQCSDADLNALETQLSYEFKVINNDNYNPKDHGATWADTYITMADLAISIISIDTEERKHTLSAKFSQQQPARNTPTQTTQPKTTNTPAQNLRPTPEDLQRKEMYAQGPYKKEAVPKWHSFESKSEKENRENRDYKGAIDWREARRRLGLELTSEEKYAFDLEKSKKETAEQNRLHGIALEQYKKDNAAYLLLKRFEK
jgi:hypothetical protein